MRIDSRTKIKKALLDIKIFTKLGGGLTLRSYQVPPAERIIEAILKNEGGTIVIMFPRQTGKNEIQAQLETYLLIRLSLSGCEIVKISPTWKPQTINAMMRLQKRLEQNLFTKGKFRRRAGYIVQLGKSFIYFFSGESSANIVGATASTMLTVDEAQDVNIEKYDKEIAPMAASTNALRVMWGTAWTRNTLLGRELRAAEQVEAETGKRCVFKITADDVRGELPAYGQYVDEQIIKLGRDHPIIQSQYFAKEIDETGGMFTLGRIESIFLIKSEELPVTKSRKYCILIDVGGEDETVNVIGELKNKNRDSTVLTIVEVDDTTINDELIKAPTYYTARRYEWIGVKHSKLFFEIRDIITRHRPVKIIIDATGVGAGLASFLARAFGEKVVPFIFTSKSKSELGWKMIAIIDTGRWKEPLQDDSYQDGLRQKFKQQLVNCEYQILPGPNKTMSWGVPEGKRNEQGEAIHDDLVMSAALISEYEKEIVLPAGDLLMVRADDVLDSMESEF